MIPLKLHQHLSPRDIILLGKVLQQHQYFEIGYFYLGEDDELDEYNVVIHYPGNGHLPARNVVIGEWSSVSRIPSFKEMLTRTVQDLNTLMNLKAPG